MINGSQFTIVWHVDDLKLSHKDPKVVDEMIEHLRSLYEELPNGEIKKMTVQRGKSLDYLGMNFNFQTAGEVKITMYDHVKKINERVPRSLKEQEFIFTKYSKVV